MARLHLVGGEKGGVGKSMTARLLAQYFIDAQRPMLGFDSDRSHGTFQRYYGAYVAPVSAADFASLDGILETLERNPGHEVVVDLAAQTADQLARWMADSDAFEILAELGCETVNWQVMDDGVDCMNLLDQALQTYAGTPARFVIVLNAGRGDSFEYLRRSDSFRRAQALRARVVGLERLEPRLAQKIDFEGLSFWAAANHRDSMSIIERRRVGAWLRKHYEQFDRVLNNPSAGDSAAGAIIADPPATAELPPG